MSDYEKAEFVKKYKDAVFHAINGEHAKQFKGKERLDFFFSVIGSALGTLASMIGAASR